MKTLVLALTSLLFFSCQKNEIDLEAIYELLPSIEYVSQKYSVNGQLLTEKTKFDPPSTRTGEKKPLQLKYQEKNLAVVEHTATNSLIIMFAVDTEIGDVLSVYEGQGDRNRLAFVNEKKIDLEPGYAIIDLKIKENYFIFLVASQAYKKYVIYEP